ncbi:MAG: hypothetical protein HQ541_13270, partial [Mariniphaga sp.]|nr:hypothetical protein [Mariniphaga sp.]
MTIRKTGILLIFISLIFISCEDNSQNFVVDFNNTYNRIWVGKDFWAIPLEDWKVENTKLICTGTVPESRVNILTRILSPDPGDFNLSAQMGLHEKGEELGSAGFLLGIYDKEDPDIKAACYFGKGIKAGVSLEGYAFLGDQKMELLSDFAWDQFDLSVEGTNNQLTLNLVDKNGLKTELSISIKGIHGLVAVANNLVPDENKKAGNSNFWFDNIKLTGSKIEVHEENSFGPILWTMYTLSKGTVKLMALLPPIGEKDNQDISLQLRKENEWVTIATEKIEKDSRTAVFKIENWDIAKEVEYRVLYNEKG